MVDIASGPVASAANVNLDYAGYAVVGPFCASWAISLAV